MPHQALVAEAMTQHASGTFGFQRCCFVPEMVLRATLNTFMEGDAHCNTSSW